MTPGHYIHKAHADLSDFLSSPLAVRRFGAGVSVIGRFLDRAIKCPVYLLPDGGNLIAPALPTIVMGEMFREHPGAYRLPHPELVIECDESTPRGEIAVGDSVPRRRAIYCGSPPDEGRAAQIPYGMVRSVFACLEFWHDGTHNGKWAFDVHTVAVAEPSQGNLTKGTHIKFVPIPGIHIAAACAEDSRAKGYFSSANAALSLMAALACKNVRTIKREPDAALNRARLARGKSPFAAHHILSIVASPVPKESRPDDGTAPRCGRERSSPMLHVRRGHVRRLSGGQRVWVNQMMVGSPDSGVLTKSFSMHGANANN